MQRVVIPSLPLSSFYHASYTEPEINDPKNKNFKPLLPEEILVYIFNFYLKDQNLQSVCRLSLVCKQFYRIANHLPFFLWTKFLIELKYVNHRKQLVCLHPTLYNNICRCKLKASPIKLWEKLDQGNQGLYTFLRLNFSLIIENSAEPANTQNEENQTIMQESNLTLASPYEQNLQKIYQLVETTLIWRKWRVDNLEFARIQDMYVQRLIAKSKNQILDLDKIMFFRHEDMQTSARSLQNILNEGILPRAYNGENKEIYGLIIDHLKNNPLTRSLQCPIKIARLLLEHTQNHQSCEILLAFLSHSHFFDNELKLKKFFIRVLKKNSFYLPLILKYMHRFPKNKQEEFRELFTSIALQQNRAVCKLLPSKQDERSIS